VNGVRAHTNGRVIGSVSANLQEEVGMSKFYFHVRGKSARLQDEEGVELATVRAALRAALKARQEPVRDKNAGRGWQFPIADEHGHTVARVPLSKPRRTKTAKDVRNHQDLQ
jgi:hypothetical protein